MEVVRKEWEQISYAEVHHLHCLTTVIPCSCASLEQQVQVQISESPNALSKDECTDKLDELTLILAAGFL